MIVLEKLRSNRRDKLEASVDLKKKQNKTGTTVTAINYTICLQNPVVLHICTSQTQALLPRLAHISSVLADGCLRVYFHHLTGNGASLSVFHCMFTYVTHSLPTTMCVFCVCVPACVCVFARAGECVSAGDALTIPSRYPAPPPPSLSPARQEQAYIRTGQK